MRRLKGRKKKSLKGRKKKSLREKKKKDPKRKESNDHERREEDQVLKKCAKNLKGTEKLEKKNNKVYDFLFISLCKLMFA